MNPTAEETFNQAVLKNKAKPKKINDDGINGQRSWLKLVVKRRKAYLDVPKAL